MAAPNPKPVWLTDKEYDYYVKELETNPEGATNYWRRKESKQVYREKVEAEKALIDPEITPGVETLKTPALPGIAPGMAGLEFEVPHITFPGEYQLTKGEGMYKRPVTATADQAQIDAFNDAVQNLIDAGYETEAQVTSRIDQEMIEAYGWNPMEEPIYPGLTDEGTIEQIKEARSERASMLVDEVWAEKLAYQDIYGAGSPRRPRAAAEYGAPAPIIGTSTFTRRPEALEEMGIMETLWAAAKPQALETEQMIRERKVREGYLEELQKQAKIRHSLKEDPTGDWEDEYGIVVTEFLTDRENQAKNVAERFFFEYTGIPGEEGTQQQKLELADSIYMSFLQRNFPDYYRDEEKQEFSSITGTKRPQEGMFFKVWGDALYRGFLTNEVDVTGLRTAMYNVGIIDEPDLITETMAGALVRDLAGITRFPINIVKDVVTYEVDPFTGNPIYESAWDDMGIIGVENLGPKEDRAWGKTISLEDDAWSAYWKKSAYEIATMRTLGDDIASMSFIPEEYETPVRIAGLGAELLIPISPSRYLQLPGKITTRAGRAITKAERGPLIAKAVEAEADAAAAQKEFLRLAPLDETDWVTTMPALQREMDDALDLAKSLREQVAGKTVGIKVQKAGQIMKAPVDELYTFVKRRAHLDARISKAAKEAGVEDYLAMKMSKPVDEMLDANTMAMRRADAFGDTMDEMVDIATGFKAPTTAMPITKEGARKFILALAEQGVTKTGKATVAGRVGRAALQETRTIGNLVDTGRITNADDLAKWRMAQSLEGGAAYRNLAKEEMLNTFLHDYVPLTPRLIVSKKAIKSKWDEFAELMKDARSRYIIEDVQLGRGDHIRGLELTEEGMKALGFTIHPPIETIAEWNKISEMITESVAAEVFGLREMIKPVRVGPGVKRAFIPEQRRFYPGGVTKVLRDAINRTGKFFRDDLPVVLRGGYEVGPFPKPKRAAGKWGKRYESALKPTPVPPPIWAAELVTKIEGSLAQIDRGMFQAFRSMRQHLGKDAGIDEVYGYLYLYGQKGEDPLVAITQPGRVVDDVKASYLNRERYDHLLEGVPTEADIIDDFINGRIWRREKGTEEAGIYFVANDNKVPMDYLNNKVAQQIRNELVKLTETATTTQNMKKLLQTHLQKGGWNATDAKIFDNAFNKFFDVPVQASLKYTNMELINPRVMEEFLDTLPPRLRQAEAITAQSVETLGLWAPALEEALIAGLYSQVRDIRIKEAITDSLRRGSTETTSIGYMIAEEAIVVSPTSIRYMSEIMDNATLETALNEALQTRKVIGARGAPAEGVVFSIQEKRVDLIAAKAQNTLKYGVVTVDEPLKASMTDFLYASLKDQVVLPAKVTKEQVAVQVENLFKMDEMPGYTLLDDITGLKGDAVVTQLQQGGIVSGYLSQAEFFNTVQASILKIGKQRTLIDASTLETLDKLQNNFGTLAEKNNRSQFSAAFFNARRRQPNFTGKILGDISMIARGLRRNIVSGQLAGRWFPNLTYHGENVITAPLIAAVTAPDYMLTVAGQAMKVAATPVEVAARLGGKLERFGLPPTHPARGIPGRFEALPVQRMVATPFRNIKNQVKAGNGNLEFFTTVTGERWTYEMAHHAWLRNNTGMSTSALQLGDVIVNDVKAAARTANLYAPRIKPYISRLWWEEFVGGFTTGRTPAFAHWANASDQAMREAVFYRAIKSGQTEQIAAELARNIVLDYGAIPAWFRQKAAGIFLYTSFMWKMSGETLNALFRTGKQAAPVYAKTERARRLASHLTGSPAQNLQRLAQLKRDVHNASGQWLFMGDQAKATLWSTYLGEFDETDAYITFLRDPVIGQVIMFGNLADYALQVYGTTPLPGAEALYKGDKPLGTRTVEGFFDSFYSPTMDLVMDFQKARARQRVPAKWVGMWKYIDNNTGLNTWSSVMQMCDIEVIKDPGRQKAGEPLFDYRNQFRFKSKEGVNNYIWLSYILAANSAGRIGNDLTGTLAAMNVVPPGTVWFRYSNDQGPPEGVLPPEGVDWLDGAAYLLLRGRAVRVPKEWQAKDAVLMQNIRKLKGTAY